MRLHRKKVALAISVLVIAAASASAAFAGAQHTSGGTITAGVLHAFTGPTAFFGNNASVACKAAASQINKGGGVLGKTLVCKNFDTQGDPADAVPVTTQMLTTSGLVMVVGPDGNDIPSVLPLIAAAKVPEMNTVGDPRYDKQKSPYFWRLTPSDSVQGPAEAYYTGGIRHLKKVAAVFTSDLSAQTVVNPFLHKLAKLGSKAVVKLTITPDQASYHTEVAKILAKHPAAIVGDMDAQTAATLLSQVQAQNGGKLIPYIGGPQTVQGDWTDAVVPAVGKSAFQQKIAAVSPNLNGAKVAFNTYLAAVTAAGANGFQQHNAYVAATYDGVIAFALAMDAAKTTAGSFVGKIPSVTKMQKGAVTVHTYKQGLAALKKGKKIFYSGASGPLLFDKYHTAYRSWVAQMYRASTQTWINKAVIPQKDTRP